MVLGFAERHWSWYQCNGADIPRFSRLTLDQRVRGGGRHNAKRRQGRRNGDSPQDEWRNARNEVSANSGGMEEAEMDRTGSGDDGDAQPSRTFMQAVAEASDDTSEVVRCLLCKEEIRGEPVTHDDGTLWHFGCDRQCEESDKNWEESVVQAAERKAQRKHDKRARQTDHAN